MMKAYYHYSFDLWKTLIVGNEEFRQKMSELFFQQYNVHNKSLPEIKDFLKQLEKKCNHINRLVGRQIHSEEMYYFVLEWLGMDDITKETLSKVKIEVDSLFCLFPPTLIDGVESTLQELWKRENTTITILSNTSYIDGTIMRACQPTKKILLYVNDFIFSDEIGYSKPNEYAFKNMWTLVHEMRSSIGMTRLKKSDILHIGDDDRSDGQGSRNFGIDFYHVDHVQSKITDLIKEG